MNKEHNFKIIVPFYNVEEWIGKCVKSIQLQKNKNFKCFLIDDISTDNSANVIENLISQDDRFVLIKNKEKKLALKNIFDAISDSGSDPEDIIVTLDGDDWFASKEVLNVLNERYNKLNCLITYGSYIEYPSMQKGKFCKPISKKIIKDNSYRKSQWTSSHLRTFKRKLWNRIDVSDLKDADGEFYRMTWDMAFMFPMLEMAGPLSSHIDKILYCYNRQNPLNDDKVNHRLQLETERFIRNKTPYTDRFIQGHILGPSGDMSGIGNQLFCVSTALGCSYDNNAVAYFPQIQSDKYIKKYKDIFYRNLNVGEEQLYFDNTHMENKFSHDEIKAQGRMTKISGYFQSHKYFSNHREKILLDLNIKNLKTIVKQKYGDHSDYVSVHVRRGDYLHLSEYHYNLEIDYYKKAISKFDKDSKYLIFSNDIDWCKNNFHFLENVEFSNTEDDWEDIILMSTCRDNIIANSSFSWWGAWLNENKNKIVIAPKKWFGPKYAHKNTKDLLPEDWIVND